MFHGLPFLLLGMLLLDIALVWLGKNTNKLLNYILESENKDYFLYYIFLQCDNIIDFLYFQTWGTCSHVAAMIYKIDKAI